MYLILCWSYLNHSLRFVGKKIRIKQKNRILNRNRNIWGKKLQLDYFPKSFSPSVCVCSGWLGVCVLWVCVCSGWVCALGVCVLWVSVCSGVCALCSGV